MQDIFTMSYYELQCLLTIRYSQMLTYAAMENSDQYKLLMRFYHKAQEKSSDGCTACLVRHHASLYGLRYLPYGTAEQFRQYIKRISKPQPLGFLVCLLRSAPG